MRRLNVRRGGEIITKSDRTAPLATKPQWSALLHQGRHACPDAKRAGLSHKGRTKKRARLINQDLRVMKIRDQWVQSDFQDLKFCDMTWFVRF
jgi:hypothetical protein